MPPLQQMAILPLLIQGTWNKSVDMDTATGSLFSWLASHLFAFFGPSLPTFQWLSEHGLLKHSTDLNIKLNNNNNTLFIKHITMCQLLG